MISDLGVSSLNLVSHPFLKLVTGERVDQVYDPLFRDLSDLTYLR